MNRILTVEDDPQLQLFYRSVLGRAGLSVVTVLNGEDALGKPGATRIELVITDVMMPEMDGYDLVGSLRNVRFDMPVLMTTTRTDFEDKKRGFRLDANDYMVRPVDVNEMILRIEMLLRRLKINYSSILTIERTKLELDAYTVIQNQYSFVLP